MKKGVLFAFNGIIVSIFVLSISCTRQSSEWEGTIVNIKDITVVKNPRKPLHPPEIFSFEEDLRIGEAEGPIEYMFSSIQGIDVDGDENIYVADDEEVNIKVYDKSGKYLSTIGKEGQGPGEIGRPYGVQVIDNREVMIHDGKNRKVHYFSLKGEFLRAKKFGTLWHSDLLSISNVYYAIVWLREPPNSRMELMKLDSELKKLDTIGYMSMPDPPAPYRLFRPVIDFKIMHNGYLLYGYPEEAYELQIIHTDGRVLKKIIKDFNPIPVSEKDKKAAREAMGPDAKLEFETYCPAYFGFVTDDRGWIYVRTWERTEGGEGFFYDVFDDEGKYFVKIQLDFQPQIWHKGKIYSIEEDDQGFHVIKRYSAFWKI